jgi:anti-sigma factor RsiW
MNCHDARPLLDARLDHELDAAGSLAVDRHLEECRACAAQYAVIENLRREIAAADAGFSLPPALESKLAARFTGQRKFLAWPWQVSWRTVAALAVVACALMLAISVPRMRTADGAGAVEAEILDNHLRALQPGHLVDVPSSDQHTVKPWFQGRTGFSPPVPDLTKDGFALIGGRLEVIHQQPAAAIVYQRRQHVISLYVWPSPGSDVKPELRELGGYHLLHWNRDNTGYWAVSDVAAADLRNFAALIGQVPGNSR